MKKLQILLVFLGLSYSLTAQNTYFNKTLLSGFAEQSVGVVAVGSNYWIYGYQMDSSTSKQYDFLYKLDSLGNVLLKSSWGDSTLTFVTTVKGGIEKTAGNTFTLGGTIGDSSVVYGFLMKVNENGDSLWMHRYLDTISIRPGSWLNIRTIRQTPDSGFILAAQIYGDQPMETRCMLIKTDSLGNMQWYNNTFYSNNIETQPWEIMVTPDSGYLVVGYKWDGYDQNGWVLKTDQYGTVQWQKVLGGQYDDFINAACITPDGNIVVVLNEQFQDAGSLHMKIKVIKYSISGNVIWIKPYYFNQSINCTSILALDDNSFVLVGETYIFDSVLQVNGLPAYIYKLDANGDSLWLRYLEYKSFYLPGITNQHFAIDMIRTSDGGFLVCGDYREYLPVMLPQSSWIVKLDSLGCDTPGCQFISIEERVLSIQELEIFPNPFSEIMHVVLPEVYSGGKLVMFDVQGKKAMETEIPQSHGQQSFTVQTPDLKPGVYLVEMEGKDGMVWRRKVMKR